MPCTGIGEILFMLRMLIFVVVYFIVVNFLFPKLGLQPG